MLGARVDCLWGQTSRVVPAQDCAAMAGLCCQGTPGGATAGRGNAGTMPGPRSGLTPCQYCTPAWGFHHQIHLRRRCHARTVPAPAWPGSSPAMMVAASAASWPVTLPRRALMAPMRNSVVSLWAEAWHPAPHAQSHGEAGARGPRAPPVWAGAAWEAPWYHSNDRLVLQEPPPLRKGTGVGMMSVWAGCAGPYRGPPSPEPLPSREQVR